MRTFMQNHVEFFLSKPKAMKVLSHEDDVLRNELGLEITSLKRQYYHRCTNLVEALKAEKKLAFNSRAAVMSLFGAINWLYTWYNPRVDGSQPFSVTFFCAGFTLRERDERRIFKSSRAVQQYWSDEPFRITNL
jgi:Tetracyclin repressor-like, C-terminal domain